MQTTGSHRFEQVVDVAENLSSAAVCRAVKQLDLQTADAQVREHADHRLTSHSSERCLLELDEIKALCSPAAPAHASAVAASISLSRVLCGWSWRV